MPKFILIFSLGAFLVWEGRAVPAKSETLDYEKKLSQVFSSRSRKSEKERLDHLFAFQWDYQMMEYPEWATSVGFPGQNGRWTDMSLASTERRKKEYAVLLKWLGKINRTKLNAADRVNYDLFRRDVEDTVTSSPFYGELLVLDHMSGVHQSTAQTIMQMSTASVKDYEDILARMRGIPVLVDQHIELLREGLKRRITPPKFTLQAVPEQINSQSTDDVEKAALLNKFKTFPPHISVSEQNRLRADAKILYLKKIVPAFHKLRDFVVNEYTPAARESIAWTSLPQGQAWYAFQVRRNTTTSLTPQQIHDIGQAEVKRIRKEMEAVIASTKFKGDFNDFLKFLRTDEQFFYKDKEELLIGYRDISKRADAELPKLFTKLPRLTYGVVAVPSYSEKSQTTAYYEPGSSKSGRPGKFFANTYNLAARPKWEMEALTLHEAVPGHHLQIALAEELEGVPEFRKYGGYTAYVEGWGLYAESLGPEMGFYTDPYSKFGQLTYEVWRAIRLVVDTGMHSLGWTREQAVEFFKANSSKTDHDINVEVDRYIIWAGQALAYKIGELKIKELRALATKELGEKFNLRQFHDVVLASGAVPLDYLERNVRDWIATAKKSRVS